MQKQNQVKVWKAEELPPDWFKRQKTDEKAFQEVENSVKAIIKQVKENGNGALVEFALKFDKAELTLRTLEVRKEEIKDAYKKTSREQLCSLKFMKERVQAFQKQQVNQNEIVTSGDGINVQTVLRPIESVGCYVPGGQAAYPSTLIMTTVPAKVAGVPRIVVCSPPDQKGKVNPLVLLPPTYAESMKFTKLEEPKQ